MFKVFIISFILASILYSFIGSTTKLFYKTRDPINLSHLEYKILAETATIEDRIRLFINNLFVSVFFPPSYIIAGLITLGYWMFR